VSLRVLVIPEDPKNNGYTLEPLVKWVLEEAGRPRAQIKVLSSPRTRGYESAVNELRNPLLHDRYRDHSLWLFFPDADLAKGLKDLCNAVSRSPVTLLACAAKPEIEIYPLLSELGRLDFSWGDLRDHARLKEDVFEPLLLRHPAHRNAGGGRREMIAETLKTPERLKNACPELMELIKSVKNALEDSLK